MSEAELIERAASLGAQLRERGLMIATVESCTGGLIAAALTEVAGASAWFERGWVTYTNESKRDLVGVSSETLDKHGAVSEQAAREMATGALARSAAQVAVAVTGIAGPTGATPGKPVGTVCFGWAVGAETVSTVTRLFGGDRAQVRLQAALFAIEGVSRALGSKPSE